MHIHKDGKKHIHQEKSNQGKSHHNIEETTKALVHVHADGKNYLHKEKTSSQGQHKSNHHDEAGNDTNAGEGKGNCCNVKVMQFEQLNKSVSTAFSYVSPVFYTAFLSTFYYKNVLNSFEGSPTIKYFRKAIIPPSPTSA